MLKNRPQYEALWQAEDEGAFMDYCNPWSMTVLALGKAAPVEPAQQE